MAMKRFRLLERKISKQPDLTEILKMMQQTILIYVATRILKLIARLRN